MNTRAIAAQVIQRVRDEGAYSNVVLPHATTGLASRDRAFVFALVTNTLRRMRSVDAIIESATSRTLADLDREVRSVLEVAIADLLTDKREMTYATVDQSVEAIKQLGRARAAPLVNGVLRQLVRDNVTATEQGLSLRLSFPDWVVATLSEELGSDEARILLRGLREPAPQIAVRVRPGGNPPPNAVAAGGIPGAFYIQERPQIDDAMVVTDAASTAAALAVVAQPGDRVLDMAAAPGGKTLHLWDQIEGRGSLVAMDIHRRRLRSARRRLHRLGSDPRWVIGSATAAPFRSEKFDRVLVDAPCTGLGTLRRRPEIAMRLDEGAPARLAARQRTMLEEAWRVTRRGGRIVYSVCTVFAAETTEIVEPYEARPPAGIPGARRGKGLLMAPHTSGTDGMFISVIEK